jgi:type VI secretion system secreted protein VgrG
MLPDNSVLQQQRTIADLQRRLALLESMIAITGSDMTIRVPGSLSIRTDNNLSLWASANRTDKVGNAYQLDVQGACTARVSGNLGLTVFGGGTFSYGVNYSVTVGANQSFTVGGSRTVNVGGTSAETVGANHALTVGAQLSLSAGGRIVANKAVTVGS